MRIEDLKTYKNGDRIRVSAEVIWEECDRPNYEMYFETDEEFKDSLSCNPHAFLIGAIIPAMHYGEKRVFIDGEICPELRNGLITVMSWFRHWFYKLGDVPIRIEAKVSSDLMFSDTPKRAGFFFSGGIDSFAALKANRLNFPLEHPWSIKDGLLVFGLEQDKPELFEYVKESLMNVASEIGITFIPVYTNLFIEYRKEDSKNEWKFWTNEFMAAALAAVAHAFARRFSVVSIASGFDIKTEHPHGSHPLIDPNYSSSDLRINYDGVTLSRLDKVKLISDWDIALQNLRVCNRFERYESGKLNCCNCEKCIRTMLELLVLGALEKTRAFPVNDVTVELIEKALQLNPARKQHENVIPTYEELLLPLAKWDRHDLVHTIEQKIARFHKGQKINNWKSLIKKFDNKYMGESLIKFKRLISN